MESQPFGTSRSIHVGRCPVSTGHAEYQLIGTAQTDRRWLMLV